MVKKLMILNAAIFVVSVLLSFNKDWLLGVYRYIGLTPATWLSEPPYLPLWQVVTYGFLHSVHSLGHLAYNMLGLFFLGSMLERLVGPHKFLVTYFGAIIAGAVLHLLTTVVGLNGNPSIHVVGASGGVLGIIVATATLRPKEKIILMIFPVTLQFLAWLVVGMDAFALLVNFRDGTSDGVGHWVHLGGALFGFLWAYKGFIWIDFAERRIQQRAEKLRQTENNDEQRMDALLSRIQKNGITSLSDKERAFLKRMSERKRP